MRGAGCRGVDEGCGGLGRVLGCKWHCAVCIVHCVLCCVQLQHHCGSKLGWADALEGPQRQGSALGLCVVLCPVLCHRLGLCTALCSTLCCAVHRAVHQGYTMHWSHALELLYVLEPCHILGPHTRAVLCSWTVHWGCSQCCSCAPWLGCALGHALGLCCAPRPCTRSTTHSGAAQQGHAMH